MISIPGIIFLISECSSNLVFTSQIYYKMGCCIYAHVEVQCNELENKQESIHPEPDSSKFDDLNLSSDSDMPPLQDWIDYKKITTNTESTAVFTSMNSSKKPGFSLRTFSNQSSIIDSFSVATKSSFLNKP